MKAKKISFASLLVMIFMNSHLQAQDLQLQWAKAIDDSVYIADVVVDNQGNLYAVGSFSGTADFDPGSGTAFLVTGTIYPNTGTFFAKYDGNGDYIFAHSLGNSGQAVISYIELDFAGNIWIAGKFKGTVDFDLGAGTANLTGGANSTLFFAKYDPSGNYLNAFSLSAQTSLILDDLNLRDITVDVNNNLLVVGGFTDTVDFDPGSGILNLENNSDFTKDTYVAKYTENGTLAFAFSLDVENGAHAVAADALGNIYLGLSFSKPVDMDPGSGSAIFSPVAGIDGVWAKYDPNGNYLSGFSYNGGVDFLAIDPASNFYISGRVADSMDMIPGPGVSMLYSVNNFDVYFGKYDAAGNYLHGRALESNTYNPQNGISTNHQSDLYIFGRMKDTMNYNPGGTGGVLISAGSNDGYIAKYDASGSFQYVYSFGSTGHDEVKAMAVDLSGNVWLAGGINDTVDMDFGSSVSTIISHGPATAFIANYKDVTVSGVEELSSAHSQVKIYGAGDQVLVDFTYLDQVDARVSVFNILGQAVAEAKHSTNDFLKIDLPAAAPQIYIVKVRNDESNYTEKVWVK